MIRPELRAAFLREALPVTAWALILIGLVLTLGAEAARGFLLGLPA